MNWLSISIAAPLIALLVPLTLAFGQPQPQGDEPIRLTFQPAGPPWRALQYTLLPEVRDETSGNAVQLYYRAFSPEWQDWFYRPEMAEKIDAWRQMPPQDIPAEANWLLESAQLREVDLAARRSFADWEMIERQRLDGASLLLPDIQSMRTFARMLAVRARLEMRNGDFDKAAHTLQTGFSLGRDLAEAPNLISALVGAAICQLMAEQVEAWVQTPGSPNLYWALTTLPRPLIDLRKPLQGERLIVDSFFASGDLERGPVSLAELNRITERLCQWLEMGAIEGQTPLTRLGARTVLAWRTIRMYPAARKFLLARGRPKEEIDAMPALQVVLLYSRQEGDRLFDETLKWEGMPYWQVRPEIAKTEQKVKEAVDRDATLFSGWAPSLSSIFFAQARLDRKVAALRCIEAIRLYAAAHKGELPAALADIQEVPIPIDPVTGSDFQYKLDGDHATLVGPAPDEASKLFAELRYELRLSK